MTAELRLRLISASVLGAIAIAVTIMGGPVFKGMVIIAGLLIYYEWSSITNRAQRQPTSNALAWITLLVVFAALLLAELHQALLLLFIGSLLLALLSYFRDKDLWSIGGVLYASLPVIALCELRDDHFFGLMAILYIFAIVWGTDIFAYFFGRKLKGPKLAPKISPGKTWSGAVFGLIFGVLAGCLVVLWVKTDIDLLVVFSAVLISLFSQIGDLFESHIKRRFNVKDSSNLIPGHGGFMDRLDGVIFGAIIAFAFAYYSQYNAITHKESDLAVYLLNL